MQKSTSKLYQLLGAAIALALPSLFFPKSKTPTSKDRPLPSVEDSTAEVRTLVNQADPDIFQNENPQLIATSFDR